jgi:hypothetical protein
MKKYVLRKIGCMNEMKIYENAKTEKYVLRENKCLFELIHRWKNQNNT